MRCYWIRWSIDNIIGANLQKYYILSSPKKIIRQELKTSYNQIQTARNFLYIKLDIKLSFESRFFFICKKASQKLNILIRTAPLADFQLGKPRMYSLITCHFSYKLFVWMFSRRKLIGHICYLRKALRIIHKDIMNLLE